MIFVPENEAEWANAGHTLYWPEGDTEFFTFTIPLSKDGTPPATYYGCSTAATEELWQMWLEMREVGIGPNALYYRLDPFEEVLLESNGSNPVLGDPFSWERALENAGMQLIIEEEV